MNLDHQLFRLIHHRAGEIAVVDWPLLTAARLGSYAEVALIALLPILHQRAGWSAFARSLTAVLGVYLCAEAAGRLSRRKRPFVSQPEARALMPHPPDRSFPSRHVASAISMSVAIAPLSTPIAKAMTLVALTMGLGRVRAGLHYPSDILAGVLLGLVIGLPLRWRRAERGMS